MAIVSTEVKNQENRQFARVGDNDGNRSAYQQAEDSGTEPLADEHGRLIVRIANSVGFLDNLQLYENINIVDQAVMLGGLSQLVKCVAFHRDTQPRFLQFHDSNAALGGGEVPEVVFYVPGNRTVFEYDKPTNFTNGVLIAISSTELTYTAVGGGVSLAAYASLYDLFP